MPKINAEGHATYAENIGVEPQELAPLHEPPSDAPGNRARESAPSAAEDAPNEIEQAREKRDRASEDDKGGELSAGNSSEASSRKVAASSPRK